MKTKTDKKSRNLLIALLLGDGTISSNYVFKLSHSYKQKDYLLWKISLLNKYGIKNNGLKEYISSKGYNKGNKVYYTQLKITNFIKLLRRIFYKPKKIIANRKMLNRLDSLGIAIWYMDDGHINFRRTGDKIHGFYIKISTCEPKKEVQILIDYFKEVWDIHFYMIHEGRKKDSFSLCCGTKQGKKFLEIVAPHIEGISSMKYKIQYDLNQRTLSVEEGWSRSQKRDRNAKHSKMSEDIV